MTTSGDTAKAVALLVHMLADSTEGTAEPLENRPTEFVIAYEKAPSIDVERFAMIEKEIELRDWSPEEPQPVGWDPYILLAALRLPRNKGPPNTRMRIQAKRHQVDMLNK